MCNYLIHLSYSYNVVYNQIVICISESLYNLFVWQLKVLFIIRATRFCEMVYILRADPARDGVSDISRNVLFEDISVV